jgi:acyl-CoA dehydrogenase
MQKEAFIERLLSPLDKQHHADLKHWHNEFKQHTLGVSESIQRAIIGGRYSDCVGFAFASGYQSAIENLFELSSGELASFCVSEAQGNHPKAILSEINDDKGILTLSGHKTFVSGGGDAQRLFIACRETSSQSSQPSLKVVSLDAQHNGISIQPMPPLPFVPQVTHGQVILKHVNIEEKDILEGDGYLNYIKPFRTCEDIHVSAAVSGYLLGEAIDGQWPEALIERYLSLILSYESLASMNLSSPSTHLSLAGQRGQMQALIEQSEPYFERSHQNGHQHWQRDKALLNIAKKAHIVRTEKAWKFVKAN